MIPRHTPTYSFCDILDAVRLRGREDAEESLKQCLAEMYGAEDVFLFSMARVALYSLLKAFGRVGEVVIPAYNCIGVPEAVTLAGYLPRFVDIDPSTFNAASDSITSAMGPNVTVVVVTHQFGVPCAYGRLRDDCSQRGILLVDDAAAALGATQDGELVGKHADATMVSFGFNKVIDAVQGGALIVYDKELARKVGERVKLLRRTDGAVRLLAKAAFWKLANQRNVYRLTQFTHSMLFGEAMFEVARASDVAPEFYRASMPALACSLAAVEMKKLAANVARRNHLAQIYSDELSSLPFLRLPAVPQNCCPSWIQYPIVVDEKARVYRYMQRRGIDLSWNFRYSCPMSYGIDGFPCARYAAEKVLGFPTYPMLSDENARSICQAAREYPAA